METNRQHSCAGITATGERCMNRSQPESTRCKIHDKVLIANGPHTTELLELEYVQQRETRKVREKYRDVGWNQQIQDELQLLTDRHIQQKNEVKIRHRQEIARTGIDPDAEAKERKRIEHERKLMMARQRRAVERQEEMRRLLEQAANHYDQPIVQQQQGELRNISMDAQNVHRTPVVKMVNKTIQEILKVPVPEDYRWNMTTCSKTPGDIVLQCKLTPKGAWQMTSQYCQDDNVYGLGKGIYGRVLDCVWQYILNSSDKNDLMKILRQEMEDNIGKCAQGNLTRLCNILGGYLNGVVINESYAEILGRKFPEIAMIQDGKKRIEEAYKLLVETSTPQSEWMNWITPIMNYEDDEEWYHVEILNNSSTGTLQITEIPYETNYDN